MRVLITGTDSGLGLALTSDFRNFGHTVVGTTPVPILSNGQDMFLFDANDPDPGKQLARDLLTRSDQPFDVVVNNAGINAIRTFENMEADFLRKVINVNAIAPAMLVHHLLMSDLLTNGSRICNIISDAAWRPMRHSLAYNMSKAAVDMATKQMARELTKPYGLTIFGVRPGKIKGTKMSEYIDKQVCELRGWTPAEALAYYQNNSVSGEEMPVDKVARLVSYLCTEDLPISGACLDLAG